MSILRVHFKNDGGAKYRCHYNFGPVRVFKRNVLDEDAINKRFYVKTERVGCSSALLQELP